MYQHLSFRLPKLLSPKRLEMSEENIFLPSKKKDVTMQTANIPRLLDHAILITHIIFIFSHLKYLHAWPDDKSMQLFLLTIQFVKKTCQISYTTYNTCPLRAIRTSPTNITVPSAQWFSGIDQKLSVLKCLN